MIEIDRLSYTIGKERELHFSFVEDQAADQFGVEIFVETVKESREKRFDPSKISIKIYAPEGNAIPCSYIAPFEKVGKIRSAIGSQRFYYREIGNRLIVKIISFDQV